MAEPLFFAPLRVPLVDNRTGLMSREWYLFFQALWLRTGGAVAPTIDDLLQNSAEGIGTGDVLGLMLTGLDSLNQLPTVVAELREQVAVQAQRLQDLALSSAELAGMREQIAVLTQQAQDAGQGPTI